MTTRIIVDPRSDPDLLVADLLQADIAAGGRDLDLIDVILVHVAGDLQWLIDCLLCLLAIEGPDLR